MDIWLINLFQNFLPWIDIAATVDCWTQVHFFNIWQFLRDWNFFLVKRVERMKKKKSKLKWERSQKRDMVATFIWFCIQNQYYDDISTLRRKNIGPLSKLVLCKWGLSGRTKLIFEMLPDSLAENMVKIVLNLSA